MKSSTVLASFSLFFASVMAQTACAPAASAIPTCGIPCIQTAAAAVGCGADNYSCRCSNAEAIQNSAIGCVLSSCGLTTGLEVQASASAVCACVATAAPDARRIKRW